jgi:hypothetical protein
MEALRTELTEQEISLAWPTLDILRKAGEVKNATDLFHAWNILSRYSIWLHVMGSDTDLLNITFNEGEDKTYIELLIELRDLLQPVLNESDLNIHQLVDVILHYYGEKRVMYFHQSRERR